MTFEHHIFVDFENVREADIDLLEGHSAALTLVLGRQQKTLSLSLVEALRRLPPEQVTLVQSSVAGRNALDFVLACLVGRAVEGHPGVSVHVVSKDKGFDSLIAHLRERGVAAARHEALAAVPVLARRTGACQAGKAPPASGKQVSRAPAKAPPATVPDLDKPIAPVEERVACLARRLAKAKSACPQRRSTLITYVRSQLGEKLTEKHVKETIEGLIERGVLTISSTGKVAYSFGGEPNKSRAAKDDDDFDFGDLVPF